MKEAAQPVSNAIGEPKTGVLLVNLGTPDRPDAKAVRQYLAEFLSDRRVVDYPRIFWLPLLHGVILNTRPAKTARNYQKIWRRESDESPLRYFTRQQAALAQAHFGDDVTIDWAMRYGSPSIFSRLEKLKAAGCKQIIVLPLYPQYSATTTAAVEDEVARSLDKLDWRPAIQTLSSFYDEPAYIKAIADITARHIGALKSSPEHVLLSFHGLPQRLCDAGDPYHDHCTATARAIREAMGWTEQYAPMTFQSQFGPEKWLTPATDQILEEMGRKGVKHITVMTPGFVADCIETLEEIAITARDKFLAAGGDELNVAPCLNDSNEMIGLIGELARTEIKKLNI